MTTAFCLDFKYVTCPNVLEEVHHNFRDRSGECYVYMKVRYMAMTVENEWFWITGQFVFDYTETEWLTIEECK